jgi:hypothetical protein
MYLKSRLKICQEYAKIEDLDYMEEFWHKNYFYYPILFIYLFIYLMLNIFLI